MNNKQLGNKFEEDFANFLSEREYWVHLIAGKKYSNSQPCDIIAIIDDETWLYDCKTLNNKTGLFPLSRIEENQRRAFKRLKECGNEETEYVLAILWQNNVYLISLDLTDFENKKSFDLKRFEPDLENFYENND